MNASRAQQVIIVLKLEQIRPAAFVHLVTTAQKARLLSYRNFALKESTVHVEVKLLSYVLLVHINLTNVKSILTIVCLVRKVWTF